jgi:hypothetical protein
MAKMIVPKPIYVDPLIHKRNNKTPVNVDSIEAMTPETDYKVVGTFVNIETRGVAQKFCGKYYSGMPYFCQTLEEGVKYTIPLSVARWINERFGNEKHSHIQDEKGNPIKDGNFHPRGKFIIEQHLKAI